MSPNWFLFRQLQHKEKPRSCINFEQVQQIGKIIHYKSNCKNEKNTFFNRSTRSKTWNRVSSRKKKGKLVSAVEERRWLRRQIFNFLFREMRRIWPPTNYFTVGIFALIFFRNREGTEKFDFAPTASTSLCFVVDGLLIFLQGFFWGIGEELGSLSFLQRLQQVCFVVDGLLVFLLWSFWGIGEGKFDFPPKAVFFLFIVVDG